MYQTRSQLHVNNQQNHPIRHREHYQRYQIQHPKCLPRRGRRGNPRQPGAARESSPANPRWRRTFSLVCPSRSRVVSLCPSLALTLVIVPPPPEAYAITSPPKRSPSPPLGAVVKKNPNINTPLRRQLTLDKIREETLARLREEEQAKVRDGDMFFQDEPQRTHNILQKAQAAANATPPAKHPQLLSPSTSPEEAAAPPATAPQPRAAPSEEQLGWRKLVWSIGGYFSSPFIRKRAVEEDEETPTITNKRTRRQEPSQVTKEDAQFTPAILDPTNTDEQSKEPIEAISKPAPKPLPATTPKVSIKRKRVEELENVPNTRVKLTPAVSDVVATPDIAIRARESPEPDVEEVEDEEATPVARQLQPIKTPSSAASRTSPSSNKVQPGTKELGVPSSLSTITEYSEPSFFSHLSEAEEASPTPSKPPRIQQMSGRPGTSHSTPKQPRALQVRQSTPRRTPIGTPMMRRAAQVRAAREAEQSGGPTMSSFDYSTTKRPAPLKPKETNADARQAKLIRMRELQKELEELQNDEDILEIQSHRRKRVKIDNLVSIPHNLPGDPSGTFRVPEVDSDDEMEVYDDVEERSNVFEDSERMEVTPPKPQQQPVAKEAAPLKSQPAKEALTPKSQPAKEAPTPKPQPAKEIPTPKPPPVKELFPQKIQPPTAAPVVREPSPIEFDFPEIGPIPEGYYVSEEYKAEACAIFEQGLAEFLAAH